MPSRKNRRILKSSVPYLPHFLKNKEFIHDIGVNDHSIPNISLFKVLGSIKANRSQDRNFLIAVYREFHKGRELVTEFQNNEYIYCFHKKNWINLWSSVWSIEDDNLFPIFSELKSQYPSLKLFFLDFLGIKSTVEFSNISSYLESFSDIDVISDKQRRNLENAMIYLLINVVKGKIDKNEVESLVESKFIPIQDNTLVIPENAYFADEKYLYSVFCKDPLNLFKLLDINIGFKNLFKAVIGKLGLKILSNSVTADINTDISYQLDKTLSSELKNVINIISYVVYHRFREIYNSLPEDIRQVKKLNCYISENIKVKYSLEGNSHECTEDVFVQGRDIYLTKFDISAKNRIFQNVLFRYFQNTEALKDIIIHIVGIIKPEDFHLYLLSHGIPIPESKSDLIIRRKPKKILEIPQEEEYEDFEENEASSKIESSDVVLSNKKITIEIPQWIPEVKPDFIVSIDFPDNSEQFQSNINPSNSEYKGSRFFHSYQFIKNNENDNEIGNWGEAFVFNNLIEGLKNQFSGCDYVYNFKTNEFAIYNIDNEEVASLSNGNDRNYKQSGYDFLKIVNGIKTFIEIKTTTSLAIGKYILKKEQWNCCRANPDNYELYFVKGAGTKKASIIHVPKFFRRWEKGMINVLPHDLEIII